MKATVVISMFIALAIFIPTQAQKWKTHTSKIDKIFIHEFSSSYLEVVRLFEDNTYQHIYYWKKGKMRINTGKYKPGIGSYYLNAPEQRDFSSQIHNSKLFYRKGLYKKYMNKLIHKTPYYTEVTDSIYKMPFYLNPLTGQVALVKKGGEKLDLQDLVNYLIRDCETDREKAYALARFICLTIEYGDGCYKCYKTEDYLSSKTRRTVCGGYSKIFNDMAICAGLESKKVSGEAKNSYCSVTELSMSRNHAWNIVKIDGKWNPIDVTWMDPYDAGPEWFLPEPERMILSHFPEFPEEQCLDTPVCHEVYIKTPYLRPRSGKALPDFYPQNSIVYTDSIFTFKIKKVDLDDISINEIPLQLLKPCYKGETYSSYYSYFVEYLDTFTTKENDYLVVSCAVDDKTNAFNVNIKGYGSLTYVVVKGDENTYMDYLIENADSSHIDSYIKGVLACLKTGNKEKLVELLGDDNPYINKRGKLQIPKDLKKVIEEWNGRISSYHLTCSFSIGSLFDDSVPSTSTDYHYIYFSNDHIIQFEKYDNAYKLIGMMRYNDMMADN